jgi:hypothetical protein
MHVLKSELNRYFNSAKNANGGQSDPVRRYHKFAPHGIIRSSP